MGEGSRNGDSPFVVRSEKNQGPIADGGVSRNSAHTLCAILSHLERVHSPKGEQKLDFIVLKEKKRDFIVLKEKKTRCHSPKGENHEIS